MIIPYTMWEEIAVALDLYYEKAYLTLEQNEMAHPLVALAVPEGTESFFGTKTQSLFIAAIPFAWEKVDGVWQDNWPPPGYADAVIRHNEKYSEFAIYKAKVWTDFNIVAQVMAANPFSRFQEMMEAVDTHMQEMCAECQGFEYMGRIESTIEYTYFVPIIDAFLLESAT